MADFPTFGQYVAAGYKEIPDQSRDLVGGAEGGYEITRRRYTRIRDNWQVTYVRGTLAEKNTLKTFIDEQGLSGSFNWTHPQTLAVHVVRFHSELPDIIWVDGFYVVTINIKEV